MNADLPAASLLRQLVLSMRDLLVGEICPFWWSHGIDWRGGGFREALDQAGNPAGGIRRVRVIPRQMYAFTQGRSLGWDGDPLPVVTHGLQELNDRFLRPDGLYHGALDLQGAVTDPAVLLYDQAFVLFGLAQAYRCGIMGAARSAAALRDALDAHLRDGAPGFRAQLGGTGDRLANPHMHLFEAALAWRGLDGHPAWQALADEIGTIAIARMIDPGTFVLREHFQADWSRRPDPAGRLVEPGHLFEWSWLLMQWRPDDGVVSDMAYRLLRTATDHGVQDGAAVMALSDDLTVQDGRARLWQQAEWLRATAHGAVVFHDHALVPKAIAAARALERFQHARPLGRWWDMRDAAGSYQPGPSPASSLYHIVAAVDAAMAATRNIMPTE